MISYKPFWNTLKRKKVSTYALIEKHKISSSFLTRIRKNEFITLRKIVDLCIILDCRIEDIVIYVPEDDM
ncbi:MAG: helix-turn-helix transcriptional regulator [Oscillospiraceae bacterium]|nr:helix-turn-helix transcriptional regulator [Oscillospiraceae bacterium]